MSKRKMAVDQLLSLRESCARNKVDFDSVLAEVQKRFARPPKAVMVERRNQVLEPIIVSSYPQRKKGERRPPYVAPPIVDLTNRKYLNIDEAAALLDTTPFVLGARIQEGLLQTVVHEGKRHILRSEVERYSVTDHTHEKGNNRLRYRREKLFLKAACVAALLARINDADPRTSGAVLVDVPLADKLRVYPDNVQYYVYVAPDDHRFDSDTLEAQHEAGKIKLVFDSPNGGALLRAADLKRILSPKESEDLLNFDQAAAMLETTADHLVNNVVWGELNTTKRDGQRFISRSEAMRFASAEKRSWEKSADAKTRLTAANIQPPPAREPGVGETTDFEVPDEDKLRYSRWSVSQKLGMSLTQLYALRDSGKLTMVAGKHVLKAEMERLLAAKERGEL